MKTRWTQMDRTNRPLPGAFDSVCVVPAASERTVLST